MKRKILVYDTAKAYSRMIKLYFPNEEDVVYVTNRKKLPGLDIDSFDGAFIVVNDGNDLIEMVYINSKIRNVYLGTDIHYIKEIVHAMPNVTLVDLQLTKSKIMDKLEQLFFSKKQAPAS